MTDARSRSTAARRLLAAAALVLALPLPALAWGPQGHRLVAELAWNEMSPAARAEADKLLAGEPDPTLPGIANWADQLRAEDPDLGKRSAKWHYVNLGESDCRYDAARDCPGGNCVVAAIAAQSAILADRRKPRAERLQALKFVVHLVGDVHQPLHAGYARDKGGNDFQLAIPGQPERPGGYGANLHSLWDSRMLSMSKLGDDKYLARLEQIQVPAVSALALPPPAADWAEDSCKLVLQPGFYPPTHKLAPDYVATWRPLAETQLRLGGEHLAKVLDAALAPGR
ncbi:S1/P1 nuclease [Lysobacter enzymogenes]|uniref:Endonuclease n=1 Tax=Lysobacter enzymogenes TaxID=69 RepID=A0A3N2RBS4_LYSEN|nr:S1/P1 nuclease [Lysobacter enzymogenes]ROU04920.1 endonuclease [Lysobacter enzymogenes]